MRQLSTISRACIPARLYRDLSALAGELRNVAAATISARLPTRCIAIRPWQKRLLR